MNDDFLDAARYKPMFLRCRCMIFPFNVFLFYKYKVNINYFIYN